MFGGKRNNYFRYSWKRGRGHFQKFVQFIIPGRVNRIMNAVIPAAMARRLMARMLAKTVATAATLPTAVVDKR